MSFAATAYMPGEPASNTPSGASKRWNFCWNASSKGSRYMSQLTIFDDLRPGEPVIATTEAEAIALELAAIGVQFERWESPVALQPGDDAERILQAYKPH